MARIGLFPLALVLVPTERVPLNIFEPRYRELIGECLENDEDFGIVLTKESGDIHHIGTRARATEVLEVLSDGRMHIVVEGGDRFRVLEVEHTDSFDTATIEELVDSDDQPDPAEVQRVAETYKRAQELIGAPGDAPDPDSPQFDFEITARVDFSTKTKQELLELTSPRRRTARLAVALEHAVEAMTIDRELRQRASGNGKVDH